MWFIVVPTCFQTKKHELTQILIVTSTVKPQFFNFIFQRLRSTIFKEEISNETNSNKQESGSHHTSNA